MNSVSSSLDLPRQNSCESHVSVYYEQQQEKEPSSASKRPCTCTSNEKIFDSPPVEIHDADATSIDLPPLRWHGYENPPTLLTVTNTGRTILMNGHWTNVRPYIEGGPLNGTYLFSQIHFHCPSEHEINGKRYPLEMHIVHYKTSYLTQEKAMQEKDGTVVLAYLFKLSNSCETVLSQITALGPMLREVNSRTESNKIPLDQLITPFCSNYYIYWGSLTTKKNKYLLQWLINCKILGVTKREVEDLSNLITCAVGATVKRTPQLKPEFDAIYHVGEADYALPLFRTKSTGDLCTMSKNFDVSDVSCGCKVEKTEPEESGSQVKPVVQMLYECPSRGFVSENNYRAIGEKYVCCQCKSIEVPSYRQCQGRAGLAPRKIPITKPMKPKKRTRVSSDVEAEGSENGLMLKCKSKSLAYYRNIRNKEKTNRKRKSQKPRKSPVSGSEKSSSKSSVSDTKSKDKLDSGGQSGESEAEPEVKKDLRFKVEKKPKSVEEKKVKKKKKKKKEAEESESSASVKKGQSEPSVKAINELPRQRANSTVMISLSSKSSIIDSEGSQKGIRKSCSSKSSVNDVHEAEKKKKAECAENPEVIVTQTCDAFEKPLSVVLENESENSSDTEKEKAREKSSVSKSPSREKSKSRVNQQKTKNPDSSDKKNLVPKKSKSKSPLSDILMKSRSNMKKESESSECSDSKMAKSSGSKCKISRSKTVSAPAKSAQEVKCSVTKSKLEIENLKSDIAPPKDKKPRSSRFRKKSTEDAKLMTKADSEGQNSKQEYDITTIFEKKPDPKKAQPVAGDSNDIPVNFFLAPSTSMKSYPSCGLTTSESDCIEERKPSGNRKKSLGLMAQEFTVNTVTIVAPEMPKTEPKEEPKGCLLMEHVFRREPKAKVSEWFSQEYRVTIMYDEYVVQEYGGKFHPQELKLGDYEKLNLAPKYPELECFNFRLQDCSIKKESKDKICVRVKFLLKDLSVLPVFENREDKPDEISDKKEKLLFDQQTQCSVKELNLVTDFVTRVLTENKNSQISDPRSSEIIMNKCPKLESKEKNLQMSDPRSSEIIVHKYPKSESKGKEKQPSTSGERQRLQSRSRERQRLQSSSEERQRPQSRSGERESKQSPSGESQRQQSSNGESQRQQSSSGENQRQQSSSKENQRQQSRSGERQRAQSPCGERQKTQSPCGERQRAQSPCGERQRQQSSSGERQRPQSQSRSRERQRQRSSSEERQRVQSRSGERQRQQPNCGERERAQSRSGERQRPQSRSRERQRLQSSSEEKQRPQSPCGERERPQSPSGEKERPQSPCEESERPQSPSGEKERPKSPCEESERPQSPNEEKERPQSPCGEKERKPSSNGEKEGPKSRRAEREKQQSKSEDEQKQQPKNQEKQGQQSKSAERQRAQSKNEDEQKRQPKNQGRQRPQSKSEVRQRQQSKSGERQRAQSKSEDEQKRQPKNQEKQKQQSKTEEEQKMPPKNEEKLKEQSKSEECQKQQSKTEEEQKMPPKSEERLKEQSKSEECQKPQSKNEEEQKRRSKNEEGEIEQSKSEEKPKQQLKTKSIHWENETTEPQKCTNKLQNDSDAYSQDASQSSVAEAFSTDSTWKEEKIESEQVEKKVKSLYVKRRKTVYFIYDKVEKDEGTGKKVFVGSFKTKEELDDMKKPKGLPQENENVSESAKSEETSEAKCFAAFQNKKPKAPKIIKPQEIPVPKSDSSSKNSSPISPDTAYKNKDLVTLHKYKPRYPETNRYKRDNKNVSPTKAVVNPQKSTDGPKRPTSASKGKAPKPPSKEVREPSEPESQKANLDCDDGKTDKKIKAKDPVPTKSQDNFSQTEAEDLEKSGKGEQDKSQKSLDKKESEAALILIPVVGESLSKTDVIFIKDSENSKKDNKKDKNNA